MKKLAFLAILLIHATGSNAQDKLQPFTAINVFGPFEIRLIKSDQEKIEMAPHNVDKDDLVIEVRRGELTLKLKSRHYLTDWDSDKFEGDQMIKTRIYYKKLDEIQVSAGAQISSDETLRNKKLELISTMGAQMKLNVVGETIYCKSSMGAVIDLGGRCDFFEVKANMGGMLKALRLDSKIANVKASMGSEVSLNASDEIDIDASFGSAVRYAGNPTVRHTNQKMGADIYKKN